MYSSNPLTLLFSLLIVFGIIALVLLQNPILSCAVISSLIISCCKPYAHLSFTKFHEQRIPTMKPQYLRVTILAILLYIFTSSGAMAAYEGCEYKRQQLEHRLEYALSYNNAHRVAGLQSALRRINEYCTDKRLLTRKENKVAEKQRKVTERLRELEQVRASGKQEKIMNKQAKLDEAREELAEARRELPSRPVQ